MDEHAIALAWADTHQDDPRAKDIQAKAWASQNPADPRSQAILERLAPDTRSGLEKVLFPAGKASPGEPEPFEPDPKLSDTGKTLYSAGPGLMAGAAAGPLIGGAAASTLAHPIAGSVIKTGLGTTAGASLAKLLGIFKR